MSQIWQEIREEEQAVKRSVALGTRTFPAVAQRMAGKGINRIYAVGCGSSYFAGMLARYAFERFTGIPTIPVSAVDFHTYSLSSLDSHAVVLGISQSGESFETVDALRLAKGKAGLLVALTNNAGSSLAAAADEVLLTDAGPEKASGTKTVLTQMLAAYQFALALAEAMGTTPAEGLKPLQEELTRAAALVGAMHADTEGLKALAEYLQHVDNLYVVTAGPFTPLAMQITNTAREIVRIHTQAFDVTEFRHGPMEILGPGTHVMLVSNANCTLSANVAQMARLAKKAGATVIAVTDSGDSELLETADRTYTLPAATETLGATLYLAAFHVILYYWSIGKGIDPDRFQNIVKTWTQEVHA
jgi:glucosamine--fructose-6-phosphate aminotransferase (isomerizing)